MDMATILTLIGVAGTICGIVFGYVGYQQGIKKEGKQDAREAKQDSEKDVREAKLDTEKNVREVSDLKANTDYIRKRIDDVLLEQRELNRTVNVHAERLTRVEESTKQAHKRIDEHIALEKGVN